jgi:hypothetical protein
MPVLPPLGTGLTPLFQWLAVPAITVAYAGRTVRRSGPISTFSK